MAKGDELMIKVCNQAFNAGNKYQVNQHIPRRNSDCLI